jgi:hypothetical protein
VRRRPAAGVASSARIHARRSQVRASQDEFRGILVSAPMPRAVASLPDVPADSDHTIHHDRPDLVAAAVLEVVEDARRTRAQNIP